MKILCSAHVSLKFVPSSGHKFLPFVFEETPRLVLLQTSKTQMKCSIMLHFIRVLTVCKAKKDIQTNIIFLENYNLTPLDMYNGLSEVYCIKPEGIINKYTKGYNAKTCLARTNGSPLF